MPQATSQTQAFGLLGIADQYSRGDPALPSILAEAQVYATLAVSEQLDRIATILEVAHALDSARSAFGSLDSDPGEHGDPADSA